MISTCDGILFSVIVPVFNCEALIASFIESLQSQSFAGYEVIFVDGASTDRTLEIINNSAAGFPFVQVLSEPDEGIYDGMNKGIALARGKWLLFIGADDSFHTNETLSEMADQMDERFDIIYGGIYNVAEAQFRLSEHTFSEVLTESMFHQSMFYRRSFVYRVGLYDIKYRLASDRDFNIRCFCLGAKVLHIKKIICNYAGNGASSVVNDVLFQRDKYANIKKASGKILLSAFYTDCRHDFYRRSNDKANYPIWTRYRYRLLFVYHGLLSKFRSCISN